MTRAIPLPATPAAQPRAGGVAILGLGHYLPSATIVNDDFAAMGLETTDEWIFPRTGIRSRHVAAPEQATSDLAIIAAQQALDAAGLAPCDIDLVLLATATPDAPVPPASSVIIGKLAAMPGGCTAAGMDLSAACAGFVFAAHTGAAFVRSGLHQRVLVVGAETLTRITDYTDRSTAILFGDGAGAVVLGSPVAPTPPVGNGKPSHPPMELLYSAIGTTPADAHLIRMEAGGSRLPACEATIAARQHYLRLEGREVFRRAVSTMTAAARAALSSLNLTVNDVRWIIAHQANARIVQAVGEFLAAPAASLVDDIEGVGNTSAASLPVALDRLRSRERIAPGELVMLLTFGAGTNWGCQVYRQLP